MSLPIHPDKYDDEAVLTPRRFDAALDNQSPEERDAPDAVVLTYTSTLTEHARSEYAVTPKDWPTPGEVLGLDDTDGRVGVVGDFGIGGPVTALVMEGLVAAGVEAFLIVGHAGGIGRQVDPEELVVASEALRDEGTSHHYVPAAERIDPPGDLTPTLREHLVGAGESVRHGPTWTTDAVFRETPGEVARYRDEGVLTVEMEAASVFAVAKRRGVTAGASFAISDYLTTDAWESNHDVVDGPLTTLFDHGIDALDAITREE